MIKSFALFFVSVMLAGQELDPTAIVKPLGSTGDWPTYGGAERLNNCRGIKFLPRQYDRNKK